MSRVRLSHVKQKQFYIPEIGIQYHKRHNESDGCHFVPPLWAGQVVWREGCGEVVVVTSVTSVDKSSVQPREVSRLL